MGWKRMAKPELTREKATGLEMKARRLLSPLKSK
jgi:hypothetical protein